MGCCYRWKHVVHGTLSIKKGLLNGKCWMILCEGSLCKVFCYTNDSQMGSPKDSMGPSEEPSFSKTVPSIVKGMLSCVCFYVTRRAKQNGMIQVANFSALKK